MSEHRHPRCIQTSGAATIDPHRTPHMGDLVNRLHGELNAAWARIADLERKLEAVMCWGLVAFVDGELDEERAAAFRSHLDRCADCRASLRANNAIDAVIHDAALPRQPRERDDG